MHIHKQVKLLFLSLWVTLTIYLLIPQPNSKYSVLFSPDDNPKYKIANLINGTKKKIYIAVYTFTNRDLSKALVKAKNKGVDVQIIVDPSTLNMKSSQVKYLQFKGIKIFVYNKSRSLMHNKFALFDMDKDNKSLCSGSLNWTYAACEYNQENVLFLENTRLYKRYLKQFEKLKCNCTELDKLELSRRV